VAGGSYVTLSSGFSFGSYFSLCGRYPLRYCSLHLSTSHNHWLTTASSLFASLRHCFHDAPISLALFCSGCIRPLRCCHVQPLSFKSLAVWITAFFHFSNLTFLRGSGMPSYKRWSHHMTPMVCGMACRIAGDVLTFANWENDFPCPLRQCGKGIPPTFRFCTNLLTAQNLGLPNPLQWPPLGHPLSKNYHTMPLGNLLAKEERCSLLRLGKWLRRMASTHPHRVTRITASSWGPSGGGVGASGV
jgi:hypothetical protein